MRSYCNELKEANTLFANCANDDHEAVAPGTHCLLVDGSLIAGRAGLNPRHEADSEDYGEPHSGARRPHVHFERR